MCIREDGLINKFKKKKNIVLCPCSLVFLSHSHSLPPVGGEQEVYRVVLQLHLLLQVVVDDLTDSRFTICEDKTVNIDYDVPRIATF